MDSYSSTSNSNADSSSSNSSSSTWFPYHYDYDQVFKTTKPPPPPPPSFRSDLHSVRRTPAKHVITKKPIAPLPPTPPKIYKVDPMEFKDVVQKLTGAPEFQPATRLQEVAPPPLSLSPPHRQPYNVGALSPLGLSLSPSSMAWCSAMLLSPGTLASFEPSVVL